MTNANKTLEKELWKDMRDILIKHPDGISIDILYKQLDSNKYNKQVYIRVIETMHNKWCFIAYLSLKPIKIAIREAAK